MPLRRLGAALAFLTRLPLVTAAGVQDVSLADAKSFFPAAGLVIGGLLALAHLAGNTIGPWPAALAVLIVWVWVTGALHLDGLGDVADALGAAHRDPERFHQILKDPHAGNFAVTAITLQIIAKLVLLAELPPASQPWALVLIPAWARWGVLVWSTALKPLRPGLAAAVSETPSWIATVVWALALGAASIALASPLLAAPFVVALVTLYWRQRLGGVTGDCLGASIEVTETALLIAVVILHAQA
jgi:adenosylcobinamide-GDP ribazoletransferase